MLSIVLSVSLPVYSIANAVNAEALAAVLAAMNPPPPLPLEAAWRALGVLACMSGSIAVAVTTVTVFVPMTYHMLGTPDVFGIVVGAVVAGLVDRWGHSATRRWVRQCMRELAPAASTAAVLTLVFSKRAVRALGLGVLLLVCAMAVAEWSAVRVALSSVVFFGICVVLSTAAATLTRMQ